jgi:hypothetical protein
MGQRKFDGGLGERAPANYPAQIGPKTAPVDRTKAIGKRDRQSQFPGGLPGTRDSRRRRRQKPHPHLRFGPRGVGRFIEAPKNAADFRASRRAASVVFLSAIIRSLCRAENYMIQGDSTASEKLLELAESLVQRLIGAYPHLLAR